MASNRTPGGVLGEILDEIVFIPTPAMRRAKAAYLTSREDNPILETTGTPTLATVEQVVSDSRLSRWWSTPGFRDWFSNKEEFRQKVEYLATLSLDTIEEILTDTEATPASRLAASKLMIEAAGKMPSKSSGEIQYLDQKVADMSRKELESFLRRQGALPRGTK